MITLTPITDPTKLEEYFRFRYRIYSESRQIGFVATNGDGRDVDAFDERALHFGWYMNDTLAGCIRFIGPDDSATPIPMMVLAPDEQVRKAVRGYIDERRRRGENMVEASRFCLAPQYRGLRTAREFVLAMLRSMEPYGVEHGLFDCHERHARFYHNMGFDVLAGAERWNVPFLGYPTTALVYDLKRMIGREPRLLGDGTPKWTNRALAA